MTAPLITGYVPCANYWDYLDDAVESILRQTLDNWELYLIADGTSADSSGILDRYRSDPRIHLVHTAGVGLAAIGNLVIKRASGKYIIRLDADDVADEHLFEILSGKLEKNPDLAMVFPDFYETDQAGEIYSMRRLETVFWEKQNLGIPPNGACAMVRVEILRAVGGYREDVTAQDGFDLWTKIAEQYQTMNVNLPLFYYRRHGQNMTNQANRIFCAKRAIKKTISAGRMEQFRPITAVIPCRRYYDFRENAWELRLAGRTLLEIALDRCIESELIDRIVVTSDTKSVLSYLDLYNDNRIVFSNRTQSETIRTRSLKLALRRINSEFKSEESGISLFCHVQAPFTSLATLEEAVHTLIVNDADESMSVHAVTAPLFRFGPSGLVPIFWRKPVHSDFDNVYEQTNLAHALFNPSLSISTKSAKKISYFEVSTDESFFITSSQQLDVANFLVSSKKETGIDER